MSTIQRMGACALIAALPITAAIAQSPSRDVLVSRERPAQRFTELGEVSAEFHQKTMLSKTSPRDALDQELREKALRLGANAVIGVTYDLNSSVFTKKGNHARGMAVKLEGASAFASVAPAGEGLPTQRPLPTPSTKPAPAPALAAPTSAPASSPKAAPAAEAATETRPSTPALAAAASHAPIVLSEGDLPDHSYRVLGAVSGEVHIKTMKSKASPRDLLDEDLRAKARAMGADAVIQIRYEFNSSVFTKKGNHATGVAVKFN